MFARRVAAIAMTAVAVLVLPVGAYADTLTVASQLSPCQLSASGLNDSPLSASVEQKPTGEIDFVWHAAAHASVASADGCVTGLMVSTQLTDTTTVPNCPSVVRSDRTDETDGGPMTYQSGYTDYEAMAEVYFPVAYFGGPGTAQSAEDTVTNNVRMSDGSGPDLGPPSVKCYRLHSVVTEYDTAYYKNKLGQYIPFCTQQVSYHFVATPAGPERVGDPIVESITC
ncbi:MAG: hypothetical protein QOC82_152 [Frankiaceae bacterium]|jgi:hypothetical protein|nr:hypothetical protein [Frankiaceae bacterium]